MSRSVVVRFAAGLVAGAAVGWYLGARAGPERAATIEGWLGDAVERLAGREEPSWEPGLEFNPDFSPTLEEIAADARGEAPSA